MTNPAYPSLSTSVAEATTRLRAFCGEPGHTFWSDDVSLRDFDADVASSIQGHQQVTDIYLLALARRHGGRLSTLDRRQAGANAALRDSLELIPSGNP